MHIPDGYLSPATCAVMYAAAAPFWYRASRRVRETLSHRAVPLLALVSAFSFVIMMFNVPLPGGTTGHAVGGAIAAIVLGPWGATIAISIALAIQALFFGDGGILAFGANAFNMAIVMPLVAWYTYRAIASRSPLASRRRVLAGAVAGWLSLNVAALCAAVEFGLQPYLFHTADGTPLYQPYTLEVAIPAMMIPHLLAAGMVEGVITALLVTYLQRANQPILALAEPTAGVTGWRLWPLWVGLAALVILTPLGLLASGTAWGEWGADELQGLLGFVPQGLEGLSGLWPAPLPDYAVPGLGVVPGYLVSAAIGIGLAAAVLLVIGRLLARPGAGARPQV
ncbi:MAG: cobalt transporter CbiM [Chloroflexi bacterium]|nr:cobalt transporter CbiM [Chloroflexota bacterium]